MLNSLTTSGNTKMNMVPALKDFTVQKEKETDIPNDYNVGRTIMFIWTSTRAQKRDS